ncbi:glutamine repeat protein-1 [Colletotrichum higginsianum]|nr:glutamine repeat protein-1 [Colletotrichum higginsianum]
MYTPGYGFSNVPPNFNTGAPPPNQNPHMQPGSVSNQPGQQMMYNPNQFAGMPGGQSGFVGGPNPAMMSGAGPAGMMQNAGGMPHMAANGQKSRIRLALFDAARGSFRPPPLVASGRNRDLCATETWLLPHHHYYRRHRTSTRQTT